MRKIIVIALVVLAVLVTGWFGWRPWGLAAKPPVIVLLLDTLRADHIGAYGYPRATTPTLDLLAKDSVRFTYASSTAPWTPASVASILSGLYPSSHGFMPPNLSWQKLDEFLNDGVRLNEKVPLLQERLKAQGYSTAAVSSNPWIGADFGFTRGFDTFRHIPRAPASEVAMSSIKALDSLSAEGSKPFFLYVHYLDPHEPYTPPERYRNRFKGTPMPPSSFKYDDRVQGKIDLYDAEIYYMDRAIGKFFDVLKARGLYERSLIVVLADHGEQFNERGQEGHGFQLFNEEIRVPLLVKLPDLRQAGVEINTVVSTVDVLPTILEQTGSAPAEKLAGISLLNEKAQARRFAVLSEIKRKYTQRASTSYDAKKLIIGSKEQEDGLSADDPSNNVIGLFDASPGSDEKTPLNDADKLEEMQMELRSLLQEASAMRVSPSGQAGGVSQETLKQLESLGYMK